MGRQQPCRRTCSSRLPASSSLRTLRRVAPCLRLRCCGVRNGQEWADGRGWRKERGSCLAMNESQRRRAARCYMSVELGGPFDNVVLTMRCAAAVSQRARGSGWAAAGVSKKSETGASLPMNSRRLRWSTTKTAELAERCRSDQKQMQMQQMGRGRGRWL
jgi:hypothetical protein